MKTILSATLALAALMSTALADGSVELTDAQMDEITARAVASRSPWPQPARTRPSTTSPISTCSAPPSEHPRHTAMARPRAVPARPKSAQPALPPGIILKSTTRIQGRPTICRRDYLCEKSRLGGWRHVEHPEEVLGREVPAPAPGSESAWPDARSAEAVLSKVAM
jgi:hypothetical protein